MTTENSSNPELEGTELSEELGETQQLTFLEYLTTEQGHEVAKNLLEFLNSFRREWFQYDTARRREDRAFARSERSRHLWFSGIITISTLTVVLGLSLKGKLDSTTTGTILGVIVGYLFGQKQTQDRMK